MVINEFMRENPTISIIFFSVLVTLVMTLVTKKFTNQSRIKELKQIQKACQIKIKDNKRDIQKISEINKEMAACSIEILKHSMRPIFITMIPLLIFFWWINANFAYYPITPGEEFSIKVILDKNAESSVSVESLENVQVINGQEKQLKTMRKMFKTKKAAEFDFIINEFGKYSLTFNYEEENKSKHVLISEESYASSSEKYRGGYIEEIKIQYPRGTGIFGTYWLLTYIITGLFSSIIFRKVFKVA